MIFVRFFRYSIVNMMKFLSIVIGLMVMIDITDAYYYNTVDFSLTGAATGICILYAGVHSFIFSSIMSISYRANINLQTPKTVLLWFIHLLFATPLVVFIIINLSNFTSQSGRGSLFLISLLFSLHVIMLLYAFNTSITKTLEYLNNLDYGRKVKEKPKRKQKPEPTSELEHDSRVDVQYMSDFKASSSRLKNDNHS